MQTLGHTLFLVTFWTALIGVLWIPITWLLLSIFTPKSLLEKFFKEPHFTLTETFMMRGYPGFLIRTSIFGWLLLIPSVDKKRNIKEIRRYMPLWYAVALRFFIVGSMSTLFIVVGLLIAYALFDF